MRLRVLLELGRVSNLPTIWSNVLAGAGLANAEPRPAAIALAGIAASLFYVGGMFLNDAFDARVDAVERPERPIPSGRAARGRVFVIGFALLLAGIALSALLPEAGSPARRLDVSFAAFATAAAVVAYDRWHKGFAWSPLVMGLCRALVYVLGAYAVESEVGEGVWVGALMLLLYVVGLTHIARFETATRIREFWPALFLFAPPALVLVRATWAMPGLALFGMLLGSALTIGWTVRSLVLVRRDGAFIGKSVVALIAGISLVDAALATTEWAFGIAVLALLGFPLTLALQRWVRGS